MSEPARPAIFTSARTLANVTAVLLGVGVVVRIPLLALFFQRTDILTQLLKGERVAPDVMQRIDDMTNIFRVTSTLIYVVTALLFVLWFYRSYRNLPALGAPGGTFTPIWAVIGWFLPFASLYMPCVIMQEVWKSGDPHGELTDPSYLKQARGTPLVLFWWLLMVFGNGLSVVAQKLTDANPVQQFMVQDRWMTISNAIFIVSGLLAIAVILGATGRQEERRERLTWFYGPAGSQPEQQG